MLDSFDFIKTPEQGPIPPASDECGIMTTDSPAIHNAPLPADGPGSKQFNNYAMAGLVVLIPYFVTRKLGGGFKTWLFFTLISCLPILMAYWTIMSSYSPRLNEKVKYPNRRISDYLEYHTEELKAKYINSNGGKGTKIPIETFQELYFNGKVSFKGDCLDVLEYKHDWASFRFTLSLFRFFLLGMIPEVIMHSKSQDEEQVRDHYDRGDDFYTWFLGPRMIYTSGVISDIEREETLEEMQDNKLHIVADKMQVKEGDHILDLGCGWGTWTTFASYKYGANVTGVTLGKNQTKWGTELLSKYGVNDSQSRIACVDYRDSPKSQKPNGKYDKITCLEMAEHVGIRRFSSFLEQVHESLEDDGLFFLQYAGLRKGWQYEDLNWGLFMNKYIFPGADASTPLTFVVSALESVGFEVVSLDNIGVHYSGTLWRWYRNWIGNKEKVVNKYGIRWYRIWEFFLATSTIVSRQGSATCYQIVLRKNLNSYHRVNYIPAQKGLSGPLANGNKWAK
ncbi:DEHA2E13552p [Debaryomyces hansenii CBS767]|uniref:sphingolipid C(9)-methyltransferase n=1 Tax=Debaryomyces hansenii (strain ATCC 36239 / CBS 767 / BCRC 21394 / JCM 1990 / NBRC 0083 / IGC 2968) TaxID=284592 RepID=B5RU09_DEBHA|nr:DEHA2E13552p [Debaryomyces hansenii CBS767]CAR65821.1 DEHA2E13552p [Debaryomyces hansenii CBS767]|eukprot:XP_002770478.1 DEHA2E13552p [Debaryomyces hansenii CBS767]